MANKKIHAEETTLLPLRVEHQGIVYQDKYKKIEKFSAQFKNFNKEYFVSDYGEKAAVVVVHDGNVLLARQYRLLINDLSFEIPGGKINENEDPQAAAARECFEETGIHCHDLQLLINYNPDLEYSKNYTHVFQATCQNNLPAKDSQCVWKPLKECLNMIFTGKISDSLSIISILAYANTINQDKS